MGKTAILTAKEADLEAILTLQYIAYQSEAKLLGDDTIPPLCQTLEQIREEFTASLFLKAVRADDGRIVGSVRGYRAGDGVHVGKLMVLPKEQRRGLGSRLLLALEEALPAPRYELFTSDRSSANLRLYERLDYQRYKTVSCSRLFSLVYLEKQTKN